MPRASPRASPKIGRSEPYQTAKKSATGLFFQIRDLPTDEVLRILENGVPQPDAIHAEREQDLVFFSAARPKSLGGSDVITYRLVELGCSGTTIDKFWQTPLFYAAREGNIECAKFLFQLGCEVNRLDVNGQTPIFYALAQGHSEMSRLLMSHGAIVDIVDNFGKTPDDYREQKRKAQQILQAAISTPVPVDADEGVVEGFAAEVRRSPKRASPGTGINRSPKRKRLTKADDSRLKAIVEPEDTREAMQAWVAGDLKATSKDESYKAPSSAFRGGKSLPAPQPIQPAKVLIEEGEYSVRFPQQHELSRLRDLERDFVQEHAELCENEPWFLRQTPADWCSFVNVIMEEGSALQAIHSIMVGTTKNHATLACVWTPKGDVSKEAVVGYVHICYSGILDISHLKVEREHQGQGLGALLIAGAVRAATSLGWSFTKMKLVVLGSNTRAVNLYKRMGFALHQRIQKPIRAGSPITLEWLKMQRAANEEFCLAATKGMSAAKKLQK